jgi:hypothetical protein
MNIKHILSVTAIAWASGSAIASEATQFTQLGGQLSRAEVKAELARAQAAGEINRPTAFYGSFDQIIAGARDRAEVRAEARMSARSNDFNTLHDGE